MSLLKNTLLTTGLILGGFGVYATPARADDPESARIRTDRQTRPDKVDLWKAQTPVKSQAQRGTCIAHSTVAALEAAYKRAGHGDLDLSEEFTIYTTKMFWLEPSAPQRPFATENKPGFLTGGFGAGYVHQLANGYGIPVEDEMPYVARGYPEYPKDGAPVDPMWFFQYEVNRFNLNPKRFDPVKLSKTKFYGVKEFLDIGGRDTEQMEAALAAGYEVVWDFDVPESIDGFGVTKWAVDPKKMKVSSGHSVLIVGYDRSNPAEPVFLIKNSWKGKERVRASYEFVRRFGTDATTIRSVTEPRPWAELAVLGRWYVEVGGKRGVLDLYHLNGMAKNNFAKLKVRGSDGGTAVDRRLGTFFLDGDPLKAYRVNGEVYADGVSVVINWDNPNQKYDAKGTAVRLTFAGTDRDELAGPEAKAVRLKSTEAFDGKVALDSFPEVKKTVRGDND